MVERRPPPAEAVNRGLIQRVWPPATGEDFDLHPRHCRMLMSPARRRIWGSVVAESSSWTPGTVAVVSGFGIMPEYLGSSHILNLHEIKKEHLCSPILHGGGGVHGTVFGLLIIHILRSEALISISVLSTLTQNRESVSHSLIFARVFSLVL